MYQQGRDFEIVISGPLRRKSLENNYHLAECQYHERKNFQQGNCYPYNPSTSIFLLRHYIFQLKNVK